MIPLPEKPTVIVLVDDRKLPVAVATNISADLNLVVANTRKAFEDEARGQTFLQDAEQPSRKYPHEPFVDFSDVEQTQGSFNRTV